MKIIMISLNINSPGLNIPFLATSIIPLENTAPTAIPILATIIMVLKESTFVPSAEFKKLTASLLTPTIRSAIANATSATNINKYIFSIFYNLNSALKYINDESSISSLM